MIEAFFGFLMFFGMFALLYIFISKNFKRIKRLENDGIARLDEFISNCNPDGEIGYFRDEAGLWVRTDRQGIEDIIKDSCRTTSGRHTIYHEAKYAIGFDESKCNILIAAHREEYNLDNNKYFEDWAKGSESFNRRVYKAMGRDYDKEYKDD